MRGFDGRAIFEATETFEVAQNKDGVIDLNPVKFNIPYLFWEIPADLDRLTILKTSPLDPERTCLVAEFNDKGTAAG
jgi:hypothetical protein